MLDWLKAVGRQMFTQVQRDDVIGLSAELSYRWFLSLFPFAIFVAGVGAFVARQMDIQNPAQLAKDQLTGMLPPDAATLIGQELERIIDIQRAGLVSFGMVLAIWFATGGTNALIKAMNRAFDVEETRPLFRRYPLAIGLTLVAGLAVLAAFAIVIVGQVVASDVAADLGIGDTVWGALELLRWPVAATLLFLVVAVIYRVGPNVRLAWRWIVPGALFFTVAWLVATFAFGLYVTQFSDYGATFGALAGVAILLIWFYLTAFVLLLGAELNGVLAEMNEPEELGARREETHEEARRQTGESHGASRPGRAAQVGDRGS